MTTILIAVGCLWLGSLAASEPLGSEAMRCILHARITRHLDIRQITACVTWLDCRGRQGETFGPSQSSHMQALLLRALREGVTVIREEF